jgi:hypothetical protein
MKTIKDSFAGLTLIGMQLAWFAAAVLLMSGARP